MPRWSGFAFALVVAGCAATTSPEEDKLHADLMSGEWTARTYAQFSKMGDGMDLPSSRQGTVALAMTHPIAVVVMFCNPENNRPVAAMFAPSRAAWMRAPKDDDIPLRVRADDGRWHTFKASFLSEESGERSKRSTRLVGVMDHDAIRIGDIMGRARSEIWIDAGGRKHRIFADDQRLVANALNVCRKRLGPAPEVNA